MALRSLVGGSILAEVLGQNPAKVLALHGWGRRGSDFAVAFQDIGALAPDLPGFGAAPAPPDIWGAADYARAIAPVLDEFSHPPVVVGHSFGGRVAVALAASQPGRVGGLVLTGVPLVRLSKSKPPAAAFRLARWANARGVLSDRRMEELRRRRGSIDYQTASGVMRGVLVKLVNESYEAELRRLPAPVHLIWGKEDHEVPLAVAQTSLAILRGAEVGASLEVLPGVGHWLPIEAPEALTLAVRRFLR
jgi:pimeloyl-ACP methyl ester carboxylesterase